MYMYESKARMRLPISPSYSKLGLIWHRFRDIAGFLHPTHIPP